jgi:hypothetical protein
MEGPCREVIPRKEKLCDSENEGGHVMRTSQSRLFVREKDRIELIEESIGAGEDVSDIIEGIALKHA